MSGGSIAARIHDAWQLISLSARLVGGRRFYLAPLLPLAWSIFHAVRLLTGWRSARFTPQDAQFQLIGFPLIVLAIGLGVRIIAAEIEQRTLEVTYTVPGGATRVWLAKLAAAMGLLIAAEALLAIVTAIFFTPFPASSLYGALQGATFYLILAMCLGALVRSEITGVLATAVLFFVNLVATGFGNIQTRFSPLFNPVGLNDEPTEIFAWTLQNRVGVAIAITVLALLTFSRAERREKLLGL